MRLPLTLPAVILSLVFVLVGCGGNEPATTPAEGGSGEGAPGTKPTVKPLEYKKVPETVEKPVSAADAEAAFFARVEQALKSRDPDDRAEGVDLLRGAKDRTLAGRMLTNCLTDEDEDVRGLAAEAIGNLRYSGAAEGLRKIIHDEDEDAYVRKKAIESLYLVLRSAAVPDLVKVLGEGGDASVMAAAAATLGGAKAVQAVDALVTGLTDFNEQVRLACAVALGKIGSRKSVDGLVGVLDDESDAVCAEAAKALGALGSKKAVPGLIALLGDSDDNVVLMNASKALSEITGKKLVYSPDDPLKKREGVLDAWKEWWTEHKGEY